jgi:hypothetical protein
MNGVDVVYLFAARAPRPAPEFVVQCAWMRLRASQRPFLVAQQLSRATWLSVACDLAVQRGAAGYLFSMMAPRITPVAGARALLRRCVDPRVAPPRAEFARASSSVSGGVQGARRPPRRRQARLSASACGSALLV